MLRIKKTRIEKLQKSVRISAGELKVQCQEKAAEVPQIEIVEKLVEIPEADGQEVVNLTMHYLSNVLSLMGLMLLANHLDLKCEVVQNQMENLQQSWT